MTRRTPKVKRPREKRELTVEMHDETLVQPWQVEDRRPYRRVSSILEMEDWALD